MPNRAQDLGHPDSGTNQKRTKPQKNSFQMCKYNKGSLTFSILASMRERPPKRTLVRIVVSGNSN
jgi:hypothetical protein